VAFQAAVEWSSRSRALQAKLKQRAPGVSFWLTPSTSPASFGIVAPQDMGAWHIAKVTPLAVTANLANQTATVTVPDGPVNVRMDFDLIATAGGQSATVLTLRQLFLATSVAAPGQQSSGTLLPAQFAIEDYQLAATDKGPVRQKGASPSGHKVQVGLHPLLSLTSPGTFSINTEFVDATELWWKVHPDTTWGWYWHPATKGRQAYLRVLAWTGGGNPMIWFVVVPDAAVSVAPAGSESRGSAGPGASGTPTASMTPADIVFYRPPPGSNAFPYGPTQAGFEASKHDDITLVNLARYLLSPIPESVYLTLKGAGFRSPELLADQVQPKSTSPKIQPTDPMRLMKLLDATHHARPEAFTDGRANAFRPVGLEAAVNRVGAAHVLFLPLGFEASEGDPTKNIPGNPQGGYEAVEMPKLKSTLQSALSLLWSVNAIGRDKPSPPLSADRELWLAGHSEGNRSVWRTLPANGADIDRVISFDSDTLAAGIAALDAAGRKRPAGRPINAFVIITPANGTAAGLPSARDTELRALRKNGVLVTTLPNVPAAAAYWHITPPPITNPFFLYLLAKWNLPATVGAATTLLDLSASQPGNWGFLFFHELAVFGGELVQPSGAAGAVPPTVRTFFEMALGAPTPLPP
jgi:hypothetical protein